MLDIISKNVSQVEAGIGINVHIVLQPNTYYTCPVGKRARCIGTVVCRNRGAAAQARFEVAGVRLFIWSTNVSFRTITHGYLLTPLTLTTADGGDVAKFDVVLIAGQIIQTTQNSGTNAEFDVNMSVKELPI